MLRIVAADGIPTTAYQIQIVTADANGGRRTWSYVTPRAETRYGAFEKKQSATFFVLPIDLDIPILDIWVTTLATSGEPSHTSGGLGNQAVRPERRQ